MKKIHSFLIAISILFTTCAYSQTADKKEGCAPLEVAFTAPAGSSTYYWDFKDGVTSDKQNPVNIFSKPGIYLVSFRESFSGPVIGTIEIKVYPEPQINIAVDQLGCAPYLAEFKNATVVDPAVIISKYTWVFGDGQLSQNENPSHTYNNVGKYQVSLGIETQFPTCNKTKEFKDAVETIARPTAFFTTNPSASIVCDAPHLVSFNNASSGAQPLNYAWDFGNNQTSNLQTPPDQIYGEGQYTAKLTVSYTNGKNCSSSYQRNFSVGKPKPKIQVSSDTACIYDNIDIFTQTPGRYEWDFGPGNSYDTSTYLGKDSIPVYFGTAGWNTITLKVTSSNGLCFGTDTIKVYIDQLIASAKATPEYACKNPVTVNYSSNANQSNVSLLWTFMPDSSTSTSSTLTKNYYIPDDTLYYGRNTAQYIFASVTYTSNITGCKDKASASTIYHKPNALLMPDKWNGCAPLSITFSDSSDVSLHDTIINYTWVFGDGTVKSADKGTPITHSYNFPGEYEAYLVVTTQNGCMDTSYAVLIEVGKYLDSPEVDFTADKNEVCPGESVTFSASSTFTGIDGYRFITERERTFHCADQNSYTWSYNDEGPQDVTLKVDYNGCISSIYKPSFVNVKGAVAKIDYKFTCEDPLKYTFTSKSKQATEWTWTFQKDILYSTDSFVHTFTQSGTYDITLKVSDPSSGCAATTDHIQVSPRNLKAEISMDTLICMNSTSILSAVPSTDETSGCFQGYTWQFPTLNRRPHTSANPSAGFTFTTPGEHVVRLIVKDANGCKDTTEKKFKVYDMQIAADFSKNPICTPGLVSITDKTVSDTVLHKWAWIFAPEDTSFIQNPTYTYQTPPANNTHWPIKVIVTDILGCVETTTINLNYYKPATTINASDYTLCFGDSVTISAPDFTAQGSSLKFSWDFGNGETSSEQENKIHYKEVKNYTVKLDFEELATGCKGNTSSIIQIQPYPVAGFTTDVDSVSVLCAPQNVLFQDASVVDGDLPLSHYWSFGNGVTSTSDKYALSYSKGIYTATHIVKTSFNCADTASREFKVYQPEGTFTSTPTLICKGDSITFQIKDTVDVNSYSWAFGDGNIAYNVSPVTHTYNFHPPSGQTIATLVMTGEDNTCPETRTIPITIHQVIADFIRNDGVDTSICFNDGPYPLRNISSGYTSYKWDFGDGNTSTEMHPDHQYATPGTYLVTLSVDNSAKSCPDTMRKFVIAYKNPEVLAMGDTVCQGDSLLLRVLNPVATSSYQWSPVLGMKLSDIPVTKAAPFSTVDYTVVETDTNHCTGIAELRGLVIEPIGLVNWDTTIIIGDQITLPVYSDSLYFFKWTPETGLSCLDCNYPTVRPLEDINYELEVTDILGCFASGINYSITVRPETFVKLPTTFTPNGDGNNDIIYVKGWGIKELIEFSIFNRWGQLIYSSSDINQGWDGKFKGVVQNSDVYVYKVKVRTWKDEELYNEGFINLVH